MLFIPVPNTVEVHVRATYLGERVENVYYFHKNAAVTADDLLAINAKMLDWLTNNAVNIHSDQYAFTEIYSRDLTTESSFVNSHGITPPLYGIVTGTPTPGNVALAVKLSSGLAGRSYRGRVFIGGISENDLSGNSVTDGYRTTVVNSETQTIGEDWVPGFKRVVVSRYSGVDAQGKPIPRTTGISTPIISVSADPYLDSQRKRLAGRGQ